MKRAVSQRRCAVAELEVFQAPRALVGAWLEPPCLDEDLAQLLAPAAGVLMAGSAGVARHADRELEAAQSRVGNDPREPHHLQARTGANPSALDFVVTVDDPNDQALYACVRNEQVRAGAEQQVWDSSQPASFERDFDRLGVRQLGEELRRAADAEPRSCRERLALAHARQAAKPGEVRPFAPAHRPTF